MTVPPLRLYNNFETFFSGEVIVHASAVIAPGVIMQAAPNSKIIIGSGVCIGMGSILQVDTGTLEIEAGANLGAGFLMVGAGKIGTNACIGSATTVFNSSVEAGEVVAPGSIVGDTSRSFSEPPSQEMNGRVKQSQLPVEEEPLDTKETEESEEPKVLEVPEVPEVPEAPEEAIEVVDAKEEILSHTSNAPDAPDASIYSTPPVTPSPRPYFSPSPISYFSPVEDSKQENVSSEDSPEETTNTEELPPETLNGHSNGSRHHIYGRSNIKSLLTTLFPHRQSLDTPSEDESEEG
ncbi:MAG: transferase [Cyanobacteria bacterium P01_A01_bin.80]